MANRLIVLHDTTFGDGGTRQGAAASRWTGLVMAVLEDAGNPGKVYAEAATGAANEGAK